MADAQQPKARRTGLLFPVLRAWLTRRPYSIVMTMGDEWVTHTAPTLRRLLDARRHYLAIGYR